MRALVTGASGFLGSHLVSALCQNGWDVTAVLRAGSPRNERVHPAAQRALLAAGYENLTAIVQAARPAIVFHTAAQSQGQYGPADAQALLSSNVTFPTLLLAHLSEVGCNAFVNVGSSWQNAQGAEYSPFNLYAATKQAFEDVLVAYANCGLRATTIRLFDTYGPDDARAKIVDLIIHATLSGQALDMSPGQQILVLSHVSDVVRALLHAAQLTLQRAPSALVYSMPGESIVLRELAQRIGRICDRAPPIRWGARPYRTGEIMNPFVGTTPIPEFVCSTGLQEGLTALIRRHLARRTSERP